MGAWTSISRYLMWRKAGVRLSSPADVLGKNSAGRSPRLGYLGPVIAVLAALIVSPMAIADQLALSGKFSIGPTGAAAYTTPIAMPPGSGGLVPSLSLQYSSQQVNGYIGLGWGLQGLPSVTRCAQTVAQDKDAHGNGIYGTVTYTSTDRACLDGQRLMLITAGASYWDDGSEYRTERDSFQKVIYHQANGTTPDYFEVHTKAGLEMDFGNTPDPSQSTNSQVLIQGTTTVRMWSLGEVKDEAGNYYTATYTHDAANGVAYPLEVKYTGSTTAPQNPYNSVQFVYADRPDQVPFYRAGKAITFTQRLTDIVTCLSTTSPCPATQVVNDYSLAYQTSPVTGRSELLSITASDQKHNVLPPPHLAGNKGSSSRSRTTSPRLPPSRRPQARAVA